MRCANCARNVSDPFAFDVAVASTSRHDVPFQKASINCPGATPDGTEAAATTNSMAIGCASASLDLTRELLRPSSPDPVDWRPAP